MLRLLLVCSVWATTAASTELSTEQPRSSFEGTLVVEGSLMDTLVVLSGGAYSAMPRQDGSFVFHSVAAGTYLLEVYDTQRTWPTVRIEVPAGGGVLATQTHDRKQMLLPIKLEPVLSKPQFFEKREGFKWSSLLMNPMMLMMLFTGGIMFVMPKMMANMDPEELKKMQEMQSQQSQLGWQDLFNPDKLKDKLDEKETGGKKKKIK
jgi:hypothetical protein